MCERVKEQGSTEHDSRNNYNIERMSPPTVMNGTGFKALMSAEEASFEYDVESVALLDSRT